MSILNLNSNELNSHSYDYTGIYNQNAGDTTERVYSYRFDLYDNESKLINTSGELLHDSTQDVIVSETRDSYTFLQDLETSKTYWIRYTVTTTNGLVVSSPSYRITQKQSINPEIKAELEASLNYNNGYIDIRLLGNKTDVYSGSFIISRACEDTNYMVWEEINRFSLMAQLASRHICRDFTVEQGKNYIYGL
jgi:hypothetical protein